MLDDVDFFYKRKKMLDSSSLCSFPPSPHTFLRRFPCEPCTVHLLLALSAGPMERQ